MGSGCSRSVVVVANTRLEREVRTSGGSSSSTFTTSASGSAVKTLAAAAIWNPFHLSRSDAEELLCQAEPGSYIFSRDLTSELFISMSVGKYVCHHAVVTRDQGYYVGAKRFNTISDVIKYFKNHPLGETTLKNEYKSPKCTPHVQMKQHPNITFPTPAPVNCTNNMNTWSGAENSTNITQLAPSVVISDSAFSVGNQRDVINEDDSPAVLAGKTDCTHLSKNAAQTLPRKPLQRGIAVERSDSSGEYREVPTSISPLLINDFARS